MQSFQKLFAIFILLTAFTLQANAQLEVATNGKVKLGNPRPGDDTNNETTANSFGVGPTLFGSALESLLVTMELPVQAVQIYSLVNIVLPVQAVRTAMPFNYMARMRSGSRHKGQQIALSWLCD